jgi:2-phospho-L-lactate guanylyltransferase
VAVVPVKQLGQAKSRLAERLSAPQRQALMLAMFADTLVALRRAKLVDRVLVVTDDRDARHRALADGADVISDEAAPSHSAAALVGIAAVVAAAGDQRPPRVLLAPADCPLLDPAQLDALLAEPSAAPSVVVIPDRHGEGTNALLLDPPTAIEPAFGPGSRERHLALAQAAGAHGSVSVVPSLALDLDTPDDLVTLRLRLELGRGGSSETRGVLSRIA